MRWPWSKKPRNIITAYDQYVRARYDAAQTTEQNRRYWAAADNLSAVDAANTTTCQTIRNRARYEVANNCYASGIVQTLANDCIGTGPKLQMHTADNEYNDLVEDMFGEWARAVMLAEKLRTMKSALTVDGEALGVLISNEGLRNSDIKLDLRLFEAEQLLTPGFVTANGADAPIDYDEYGNPVLYRIFSHHPNSRQFQARRDVDVYPAESVLHWYRVDRPGQLRGVSHLAPALELFGQLRRYSIATLTAAETAALFGLIFSTNTPPGDAQESTVAPFTEIELVRNAGMFAPEGWSVQQIHAEQPTTMYADFKHELINEVARCLNIPYNIAAGNSSGYNYASGRLDHQTYYRALLVEQANIAGRIMDRIFNAWIREASLVNGWVQLPSYPHEWYWDGHEHVDPAKEANAQATKLANHTTTLTHEYARRGIDVRVALETRANELKLMRELGIPLSTGEAGAEKQSGIDDTEEAGENANEQNQ